MAKSEFVVHEVEFLSVSTATTKDGRVVVITIRPDKGSFRPHNLAVARSSAERLLEDLKQLLAVTPLLLLLMIGTGCSGRVDVTTERTAPSDSTAVEKSHSSAEINVLAAPEKTSVARPEEQPALPEGKVRSVEIDGDGNVVIVIEAEHPQQEAAAKKPTSGWNTKIGWPNQLRGASSWTVSCYLAVWGLVVAAIVLMVDNLRRKEGGPLFGVVAMLGTAAVLLQLLPHTECGLQIVPLSPWAYSGWESFFVSLFCWTVILFATFVAIDRSPDSPQAFAVICLGAMFLNAVLSFSTLKENSALRSQTAAYQQVEASVLPK